MFKFLKNLSGKAKKIMLSVGTGVVAASAMAIAACAEGAQGADGSATTLDISTIVNSAGSTLQTQMVALVQALVPVVIGVAVAGLGMYAVIQLFRLGKKLFGTAAN
ncbi:MAG: hypothetical protein ACLU3P_02275 [[Eubacterium] siraeum]|nr:MAG TPA: hypothetical protein [Inoviridae sp.]